MKQRKISQHSQVYVTRSVRSLSYRNGECTHGPIKLIDANKLGLLSSDSGTVRVDIVLAESHPLGRRTVYRNKKGDRYFVLVEDQIDLEIARERDAAENILWAKYDDQDHPAE